jgi:hypothetical protein
MNEPGLDDRHRDKDGRIELKHGNTLNKHLPRPIEGFPPDATLDDMRRRTGQTSEEGIRQAAKHLK